MILLWPVTFSQFFPVIKLQQRKGLMIYIYHCFLKSHLSLNDIYLQFCLKLLLSLNDIYLTLLLSLQREENAEKVKEHEDVIQKLKKQKMVRSRSLEMHCMVQVLFYYMKVW